MKGIDYHTDRWKWLYDTYSVFIYGKISLDTPWIYEQYAAERKLAKWSDYCELDCPVVFKNMYWRA
jgi:hypothetical protein